MTFFSEETLFIALISAIVTLIINSASNKLKKTIAHEDRTYERKVFLRNKYEEFGELYSSRIQMSVMFLDSTKNEAFKMKYNEIFIIDSKLKNLCCIYFHKLEEVTKNFIQFVEKSEKEAYKASVNDLDKSILTQTLEKNGKLKPVDPIHNHTKIWREMYKTHADHYTSFSDLDASSFIIRLFK